MDSMLSRNELKNWRKSAGIMKEGTDSKHTSRPRTVLFLFLLLFLFRSSVQEEFENSSNKDTFPLYVELTPTANFILSPQLMDMMVVLVNFKRNLLDNLLYYLLQKYDIVL